MFVISFICFSEKESLGNQHITFRSVILTPLSGCGQYYDIIKARGEEIKVKTEEGEGAKFIIQLVV